MSEELQKRAKAFLERPLPEGMAYVPDSISERFIATYAATGRLEVNAEMTELLYICVIETDNTAAEKSGEGRLSSVRVEQYSRQSLKRHKQSDGLLGLCHRQETPLLSIAASGRLGFAAGTWACTCA